MLLAEHRWSVKYLQNLKEYSVYCIGDIPINYGYFGGLGM
jgi:hypothetical protein